MKTCCYTPGMHIVGVDFTSAPRKAKPITVAHASLDGTVLSLERIDAFPDWPSYETWLAAPGTWLGAFDFPFGLSRELVEHLGWPMQWKALVDHCTILSREELRATFKAFCDARPAGNKFAHRMTDGPAGSSPSMKWVNPPVAYMFHEGARRLLAAGVTVHGLHAGDPGRIALEGYPGLVARMVTRASYKSDERAKQTPERRVARSAIVAALEDGTHPLGVRVVMKQALRRRLVADGTADWLDAVLCAVAAAWAARQPNYGMPPVMDPVEGWTAGAAHS
ncbi:DUF429 domain-containing protein [Noviherbaspirillum denitrificans]|uniref:DUF429 domain-containing protein n=1 Tax=Noviherbaspirillum denitrificans TaxID=1968433 RepID=A0A254TK65_9BURK|nr:DUF429 domain-containing protein [Noviherbaspirillum denitrificans]OWW23040.1 hypothetical protein AYR66_24285 [Noviherbaspirillum denitrificans]